MIKRRASLRKYEQCVAAYDKELVKAKGNCMRVRTHARSPHVLRVLVMAVVRECDAAALCLFKPLASL